MLNHPFISHDVYLMNVDLGVYVSFLHTVGSNIDM